MNFDNLKRDIFSAGTLECAAWAKCSNCAASDYRFWLRTGLRLFRFYSIKFPKKIEKKSEETIKNSQIFPNKRCYTWRMGSQHWSWLWTGPLFGPGAQCTCDWTNCSQRLFTIFKKSRKRHCFAAIESNCEIHVMDQTDLPSKHFNLTRYRLWQ